MHLKPSNKYKADVTASDPDNDHLFYRWDILPEPTQLSDGGDFEARPKAIENSFVGNADQRKITFVVPSKEGAYLHSSSYFMTIHGDFRLQKKMPKRTFKKPSGWHADQTNFSQCNKYFSAKK